MQEILETFIKPQTPQLKPDLQPKTIYNQETKQYETNLKPCNSIDKKELLAIQKDLEFRLQAVMVLINIFVNQEK